MALVFEIFLSYGTLGALIICMLTSISRVDGFGLKMISRDAIESPLFPRNLSVIETFNRLARLSDAHVLHLRSIANDAIINSTFENNTTGIGPNIIRPRVESVLNSIFAVELAVGMAPNPYITYLVLDSGSDDVWVQCVGCQDCFQIKGGPFDFHTSQTFGTLSCNHPLCFPKICGDDNVCLFDIIYVTGFAQGAVSMDTFFFGADDGNIDSIPDFAFGCALRAPAHMFGLNDGPENKISGIFGLGTGPRSITMQKPQLTRMRFSYCLTAWTQGVGITSFLRFGDDAQIIAGPNVRVQTTPFINSYFVNVLGLSVDGIRLNIDPGLFRPKPNGQGGFSIDSGSAQTRLVPAAYDAVRIALVLFFASYNVAPLPKTSGRIFDPCYQLPLDIPRYPSMTFHFQDADLVVDFPNLFKAFENNQIACLTILAIDEPGPNLLGSIQQANQRFLYNLAASTISFAPASCLNN